MQPEMFYWVEITSMGSVSIMSEETQGRSHAAQIYQAGEGSQYTTGVNLKNDTHNHLKST